VGHAPQGSARKFVGQARAGGGGRFVSYRALHAQELDVAFKHG